ncbi:MAG TPA: GGDEF domain-containing protein [Kineosporiaceae bacterium]|nr:GGDEF domain-containing protein [Kineosporiaceae bacterium]
MSVRAGVELVLACPDVGPFDRAPAAAHLLLVTGRREAAIAVCREALPVARGLRDHVSCLFLEYVRGQAELELDRPEDAARAARRVLQEVGPDGNPFWRAKGLALLAAAEVDRGHIVPALDALAEALSIVESGPPRCYHHVSACSAVAAVMVRLLLFEAAVDLTATAARGASRGSPSQMLGAPTAVLLVRGLAELHALWAGQLELLGDHREAVAHHLATASAALWMGRLARDVGNDDLVGCAVAVEAFATERLAGPELAQARARAALAVTADPDSHVEWLPGRLALARAAAAAGELAEARRYLEEVDQAAAPRHRDVWAGVVQVAAAEVETLAEGRDGGDHPADLLWREIAASGLRWMWQERETRFSDLRHRILRQELAERSARTARELLVDPLTGLGNRRLLERELEASSAGAALFLDVDNFKRVNDLCGHAVGDEVLRRVAEVLRQCCRTGDVLVRYGGDEFVVLLQDDTTAGMLGRRIMAQVRREDWPSITGGIEVTVSVGVSRAGAIPSALRRSDEALRVAKQSGRDLLVEL